MEALLHYIWEHRLWESITPKGILAGCSVEIIDTGLCNHHAGPDFFEAKVQIDDITWVGAVEIHSRASEWVEHRHDQDPAYEGTILHVVEYWDGEIYSPSGRPVPCLEIKVPAYLRDQAEYLVQNAQHLPCTPLGERLESSSIYGYLDSLALRRLRKKADAIQALADKYDWYEALYITLMRYHGFGLNNDAMEMLALSLPYKLIGRYTDNPLQFDALLYGQANLIEYISDEEYRERLQQEYQFLRMKHSLEPIQHKLWKRLRTRPANFPHYRLAQVAEFIRNPLFTPTNLASAATLEELSQYFSSSPQGSIPTLLINIALPLRLAYTSKSVEIQQQVLEWLSRLPAEQNKITRLFSKAGVRCRHAADSQALIELHKEQCLAHKCIYCQWGRYILSRSHS